jgi:uncharacterized protein (DUF2252 family)
MDPRYGYAATVTYLGLIADAEGHIDIQICDLDQTVIGNPAHDLIRLGLSWATAARGADLSGVTTAKMLENTIEGYNRLLDKALKIPIFSMTDLSASGSLCGGH